MPEKRKGNLLDFAKEAPWVSLLILGMFLWWNSSGFSDLMTTANRLIHTFEDRGRRQAEEEAERRSIERNAKLPPIYEVEQYSGKGFRPAPRPTMSPAGSPFDRVPLLCRALQSVGLPTRAWKEIPDSHWQCISEYKQIPSAEISGASSRLRSNIAYYVYGKTGDRASEVKIVANVNDTSTERATKKALREATATWFSEVLKMEAAPALLTAIDKSQHECVKVSELSACVEVEVSGVQTLTLRVTR